MIYLLMTLIILLSILLYSSIAIIHRLEESIEILEDTNNMVFTNKEVPQVILDIDIYSKRLPFEPDEVSIVIDRDTYAIVSNYAGDFNKITINGFNIIEEKIEEFDTLKIGFSTNDGYMFLKSKLI